MPEAIEPLFSTPLLIDKSAHADQLNAFLRPLILARKEKDAGLDISNSGGWHSKTDMVKWCGDGGKALVGHVWNMADKYTRDVGLKDGQGPRHSWSVEMWANVNQKGHSNQLHCHPGAYWSAVYYVDDGYEGSDDPDLGGYLELLDPRMPMIRMAAPDLRFPWSDTSPDHHAHRIRPESGMLVMFPSWLNHSVTTYNGNADRISIAINLTDIPAPN